MPPPRTTSSVAVSPTAVSAFHTVMSARAIRSAYQAVVRIADGAVIGFEALARGPRNTVWHAPDALVSYAAKIGRLPELDWICRAAACRGALEARFPQSLRLFMNIEPASSRVECPPDLKEIIEAGSAKLRIVAEVTERALAADPTGLRAAVDSIRSRGHEIAIDDVGADPQSAIIMTLLHPDVIKIDRSVIQNPDTETAARVIAAVRREADATGATILAEGVETPADLATASRIGATLAQGYRFGRPARLPDLSHHANATGGGRENDAPGYGVQAPSSSLRAPYRNGSRAAEGTGDSEDSQQARPSGDEVRVGSRAERH